MSMSMSMSMSAREILLVPRFVFVFVVIFIFACVLHITYYILRTALLCALVGACGCAPLHACGCDSASAHCLCVRVRCIHTRPCRRPLPACARMRWALTIPCACSRRARTIICSRGISAWAKPSLNVNTRPAASREQLPAAAEVSAQ